MELICPDCLVSLVGDDVIDYDIGIDYVDVKETGHCPKCNKHFSLVYPLYIFSL